MIEAAIIAHGQPGNPAPLQADLEALAAQVQALLPEARVIGATLACPCSLNRAQGAQVVYPLFMAGGWFTRSELPRRLHAAGAADWVQLAPLGQDDALPAIGRRLALEQAAKAGIRPAKARLIVAGHGSSKSDLSATATRAFADQIAAFGDFARVETGFLEQAPWLSEVLDDPQHRPQPAICLPFFATAASHASDDIPELVMQAQARIALCPPVGTNAEVPALIAAALRDALTDLTPVARSQGKTAQEQLCRCKAS
ncbi:MAG: CbiX/SirB N-terminal domain-containing protein [Paracoccus sp. (in: a-proteobacteria)]|uniref:CbiX/SirB N-terminal domain-containing protein n=1 Tax=Paracoccus sp. TaxID=267 RepID=UPI0026DF098C|nr:CbiX/SirB N-terminal domain-containing protein [Paracoccus sp. (in: a-proteobacteria)]MDO5622020.1 CbiX/SirB N-terminal domain-containing protein [Paracoccus sp. (in: a-proteobacteria)]